MQISLRSTWNLIRETISQWSKDRASSKGAALAYYTLFSMAPILVIVIAIAGFVFGQEAARGEIVEQMRGLMGNAGAEAIQSMVEGASEEKAGGILAAIAAIATLILGATSAFAELKQSLDEIWEVPTDRAPKGIFGFVRSRLLSFSLVLTIGFLLLVSLVVSAALTAWGKYWGGLFVGVEVVLHFVNAIVSFVVITTLFAAIYKILPQVKIAWRDVWMGAAITAFLFTLGKLAIGYYLGSSAVASSFGAAGSIVVLLLWVYYSAQIFFLGAEFTKLFSHRHGSRGIQPEAP